MSEAQDNVDAALSTRAHSQRERILCAAQQCFIRSGFHAASMAAIAQAARMSPGLIYRYFESKNAIIQAIIARQLEEAGKTIEQLHSPQDLTDALLGVFERWKCGDCDDKNAAQFLDVTAAAARDPEIAGMVHAASAEISRRLQEVLRRSAEREGFKLEKDQIHGRTILLQSLYCGLAAQTIRDPSISRTILEQPLRAFVGKLMRP